MIPATPLRCPSLLDKAIASALLLITPEYRNVRRRQRGNGRSNTPTLAQPPAMPLEMIELLGSASASVVSGGRERPRCC